MLICTLGWYSLFWMVNGLDTIFACSTRNLKIIKDSQQEDYFVARAQVSNSGYSIWITLRKKFPYSELFWSAFFPHFPAFGLNAKRYSVSLRIQSKCEKNVDQNKSEHEHFLCSVIRWEVKTSLWKNRSILKSFLNSRKILFIPEVRNSRITKRNYAKWCHSSSY